MPAISGPFGPIVEPGWPSTLPGQPDLIGAFQSAAALRASTNAKQQEFQAQMAHYALMEHNSKYDRELAWKKYELDKRQVDLNYDAKMKGYEVANDRLTRTVEDKERDDKWRERKYADVSAAKDALLSLDMDIGKQPGDEGYPEEFDAAAAAVKDKLSLLPNNVFNSMRSKKMDSHNRNAVSAWSQIQQEEKSFKNKVKAELYGDKVEGPYDPFLHPEALEQEKKSTGWGGWFGYGEPAKPTGKLLVKQADGSALPVATQTLDEFKRKYNEIEERKKHLPHTVHIPEIGVHDVGMEPAPLDPSQREENKVYRVQTSKVDGQYRWVNGQWVLP